MNTVFAQNLNKLMEQFDIQNAQLAKTLNVDPSLVCRWRKEGCGKRSAPGHAIAIERFVLSRRLTGSVSPQVLLDKLNAAGVSCPESVRREFLDEQRTDEWNKLLLIVKNNALGKDERIKALGRIKDVALPSDCAECVRSLHDSLYSEFGMTEIISALYNAFGYDSVTAAIASDLTASDVGWLGSHLYFEGARSDPRREASYNAQGILREAYKRKKFRPEISKHFGKPQEHYDYTDLSCNGVTEEHYDNISIYFRL